MLKKWKVTFKTLSPIHIKGQAPDYGTGIVRLGKKGYIIDEVKLSVFLQEKKLIDAYVNYLNRCLSDRRHYGDPSIDGFFRQHNDQVQFNESTLKRISKAITSVGDGNTFICDGNGEYFIPGSSIKGAVRTSLLYYFLNKKKNSDATEFDNLVTKTIRQKLTEYKNARGRYRDRVKKSFDETIMQREFQNFLDNFVGNNIAQKGPHTDLLRVMKISDVAIKNVHAEEIKVICFDGNEKFYYGRGPRKRVECLREEVRFEIEIMLDLQLLRKFYPDGEMPFTDINSLANIIKEFGEHQWQEEKNFFKNIEGLNTIADFYDQSIAQPLLRVGWGTGMLGTTIDLLLDPSLRQRIRNEVMGHNRPGLPAPHSKKMLMRNSQPTFPLGWIMIEKFEEV